MSSKPLVTRYFLFVILLCWFPPRSNAALEVGDGSDGLCNFSGTVPNRVYQCSSLVIDNSVSINEGNTPLRILVSGNVVINAALTIVPQNGSNAIMGSAFAVATAEGICGGFNGGSYEVTPQSYPGEGPNASNGGHASESFIASTFMVDKGTGGGGGGGNGSSGNPGIDGSHTAGGPGGMLANWDFEQEVFGGAGGGASGAAVDGAFTSYTGATGGAGGGSLIIQAQGAINITAAGAIMVNGGDGGNGLGHSGGGGAGAGGSIYLQSASSISIAGTLSLQGGSGGTGAGNGGDGGDGGVGRIKLAAPGNILNVDLSSANITPGVAIEYGNVVVPSNTHPKKSIKGKITSACSTIGAASGQQAGNLAESLLLAWVLMGLVFWTIKRIV